MRLGEIFSVFALNILNKSDITQPNTQFVDQSVSHYVLDIEIIEHSAASPSA